jgi:hypothetical protein
MPSNPFIVALMAVGMLNGIFSPFFVITSQVMITAIMPLLILAGPRVTAFLASLIAATATIMLAGVPAALFERITGRRETDTASYAIWLTAAVVISLPALLRAAAQVV